jgi:hypothetical protein
MGHRELGLERVDWLDKTRDGYNWWAFVNTIIISGLHIIWGIATSCGNIRFSKMNLM